MNILEYVNQEKDVEAFKFKFKGEKIEGFIKNLSQAETEVLNSDDAKLMPIYNKQKKEVPLNKEETKQMLGYQSKKVFTLLCDENGEPVFPDLETFKKRVKGKFFKKLAEKVLEDPVEKAEKN